MNRFKNILFLFFIISGWAKAQFIPPDMVIPICDNTSISMGAPENSGMDYLTIPCNSFQPFSPYLDFYRVVIQSGTEFTFLVEPHGMDDYDFGAWKNPNWDNLSDTPTEDIRGSQNDPFQSGQFNLGLSMTATDVCEMAGSAGVPEPGMVKYFEVQPGDEILIIIDRWSQTTNGYSMSFGGDAVLDCNILGNLYGKCEAGETGIVQFDQNDFLPDLEEDYPGHNFMFYNDSIGAETGTGPQMSFPFNVSYNNGEPSELFVRVETQSGIFVRVIKIFCYLNLSPKLLTDYYEFPVACASDGTDEALFDLTQSEGIFANNPDDYEFKYYTSLADAQTGNNNHIPNPQNHTSGAGTIYVRVGTGPLNGNEEGCFEIGKIDLKVNSNPTVIDLSEQNFCLPDDLENPSYNLTQHENQWTENPQNYIFSYYNSQADADAWQNAIPNPETYPIEIGVVSVVYVNVKSQTSDCFTQTVLTLNPQFYSALNQGLSIELCDIYFDGIYTYNLNELAPQLSNNFGALDFSYFTSQEDAENQVNAIPQQDWEAYEVSPLPFLLWITASSDGECISAPVAVKFVPGSPIPTLVTDKEVFACEGDVLNLLDYIPGYTSESNVAFNYYYSLEDAQQIENMLEDLTQFVPDGDELLYIRLDKNGFCSVIVRLKIIVHSAPAVQDLPELDVCTDVEGGTVNYDLTQHEFEWITDFENYNFTYFTSAEDAGNADNPIANPAAYPVQIGETYSFFVRVSDAESACFSITELVIHLRAVITLNEGLEIELCDENFNGIFQYDLNELMPLLSDNFNNLNFKYYSNYQDAVNHVNAIQPNQWADYQFSGVPHQIWAVGSVTENCPSEPVKVSFKSAEKISTQSVEKTDSLCYGEWVNLTDYDFVFTDDEEVNFQYYYTYSDAQYQTNPIPDYLDFNPGQGTTIYIRLEKEGYCPAIVRLILDVRFGPEIVLNQEYFVLCPGDEIEIKASSPESGVSFYWTLDGEPVGDGEGIIVDDIGTYTVTATGPDGCSGSRIAVVVWSGIPEITAVEAGQDYLIIEAQSGGTGGHLEYSLDGTFWQDSPRFDFLTPGETYTVYVRQDGCFTDKYQVTLPFIANFLSPDDNGLNDTWAVRGIGAGKNANLKIFDRYGKVFVDTFFDGNYSWDGKYNGRNVPSGSYWYIIEIPESDTDIGQKFVGHVTVKNQ